MNFTKLGNYFKTQLTVTHPHKSKVKGKTTHKRNTRTVEKKQKTTEIQLPQTQDITAEDNSD